MYFDQKYAYYHFKILKQLKNLFKISQNVTRKLQYVILKKYAKITKTETKPSILMDTSCKVRTKPSCITSIFIKIFNYFIPQVFSPFSFFWLKRVKKH